MPLHYEMGEDLSALAEESAREVQHHATGTADYVVVLLARDRGGGGGEMAMGAYVPSSETLLALLRLAALDLERRMRAGEVHLIPLHPHPPAQGDA